MLVVRGARVPSMQEEVVRRLERSNTLYVDLVSQLTRESLVTRLGSAPSNTMGEQFWCVIGARESYSRAAREGAWQGFSCPLAADRTDDRDEILRLLDRTHRGIGVAIASGTGLTDAGISFLLDLLEHETQHHGQLIRYLYALDIERPPSWRERYSLS